MKEFNKYLIEIGKQSVKFTYTNNQLHRGIGFFKKCLIKGLSAYEALDLLDDEIKKQEDYDNRN